MNTDVLVEMTDTELDAILGAGDGVVKTLTHERHLNSFTWFLRCC